VDASELTSNASDSPAKCRGPLRFEVHTIAVNAKFLSASECRCIESRPNRILEVIDSELEDISNVLKENESGLATDDFNM
jgi:hypothetical protein